MEAFSRVFSEKLTFFSKKNRPLRLNLNRKQVEILVSQTDYKIIDDEQYFTIYDKDKNGLDSYFYVSWFVRINTGGILTYYPVVMSQYVRGNGCDRDSIMGKRLAEHLPLVGIQKEIICPLPEPIVILPKQLQNSSIPLNTMFLAEFKETYIDMYVILEEIFVTW